MSIGGEEHVDGGVHANNPSLETLREVISQHDKSPSLFLSIGTGKKLDHTEESDVSQDGNSIKPSEYRRVLNKIKQPKSTVRSLFELTRHALKYIVDQEGPGGVNGWLSLCQAIDLDDRYRLNVGGDLCHIRLDEWLPKDTGQDTLNKIRQKTRDYLDQDDVQQQINKIASHLVQLRRQRAKTERWEAFALDLIYICPDEACPDRRRYQTRDDLRRHLRDCPLHTKLSEAEFEAALNQGRQDNEAGRYGRVPTFSRRPTGNGA